MTDNPMSNQFIPMTSITSGKGEEVTEDVYCLPVQIVNVCFVGTSAHWVLIDAGMPNSAEKIVAAAEKRFGENNFPKAIMMTHGHFDHSGSVVELAEKWKVPVYAHPLELPYLTGQLAYPKPDPAVEGGMVAKISSLFPTKPVDLGTFIQELPKNGTIPEMPGWKWIHTPGHTPGHVSFFHDERKILLAGDAFVTVRQDVLYKVLIQEIEVTGPPRYLTTDWKEAKKSVEKLEKLKPAFAITGHGRPLAGESLAAGLKKLVEQFDQIAVPDYGRYVEESPPL